MKKILFFLVFAGTLSAQTEKTVKTTVQKATVFLSGAQLFSSETVYVPNVGCSSVDTTSSFASANKSYFCIKLNHLITFFISEV